MGEKGAQMMGRKVSNKGKNFNLGAILSYSKNKQSTSKIQLVVGVIDFTHKQETKTLYI